MHNSFLAFKKSWGGTATLASLILACLAMPKPSAGEAPPAAIASFNAYVSQVESKLAANHQSPGSFLAPVAHENELRLRQGELIIDRVSPRGVADPPGAMLYHWRGTAFAAGAKASDFERLTKDFNAYPRYYSPVVMKAAVLARQGDRFQTTMRVRQHHVITVVMDTSYDVTFGRLDAQHGYSISRSTRIAEIGSPGTSDEHALDHKEEHGFLWRLNTYWSYEEKDGGLYMQIETVSLTRSIPTGLGWIIGPFVESVPRESLEFTLRSTCNALRRTF